MIIKKLNKVGVNSKTILIDKKILDLLGIEDLVSLEIKDNKLVIESASPKFRGRI